MILGFGFSQPADLGGTSAGAPNIMKSFEFLVFLSILGHNGAKTKTRSEAVLEARDAMRARAEAGSPKMHGLSFSYRYKKQNR